MASSWKLTAIQQEGENVSFLDYVYRLSLGSISTRIHSEADCCEEYSPVLCGKKGWTLVKSVGKRGTDNDDCCWPSCVIVSQDGDVIVADRTDKCLKVFKSQTWELRREIPLSYKPLCMALCDNNTLVITGDAQNIHVLDYLHGKDKCVIQVTGPVGPVCPSGVAVDSLGRIIVTSRGQGYVLNGNGDVLTILDGESQGQLGDYLHVTTNSKNDIVLSDFFNSCVHVFDSTGRLVKSFGSQGSRDGQLDHPMAICTDGMDNILVADSENHRIAKFSANGDFVEHVATRESSLKFPYAVTMSEDQRQLIVCDCDFNGFIKVFSMDDL
ncbi:tripartite motif-containing protein 3-like [Branchiostoma floridae]|uniref:Tripartite motif-containing protein 3-like n=1 Tax=Branchiostoma floridae TaxID=7739 RepID=A0A9J7L6V8_BRAFL|nr:tripartite motif-containing protein 3-like [Branchiostoma floridae]